MPTLRKAPEKLFTKVIISKGYGFNTPQDGSVCKIKIIQDDANLITGLNEEQSKEIIVGDVDEPIDRIIEDCIRTMKEEEVCCIEFLHPTDTIADIPFLSSEEEKILNSTAPLECPTNAKNSEFDTNEANIVSDDSDKNVITPSEIFSDAESENVRKDSIKEENVNMDSNVAAEGPTSNADSNSETFVNSIASNWVKIEFQLLTFTREPEIFEMSITEKWRRASYHKQKGLELYARGVYQYAFRRFGLTLKYVISLQHDVPSGQEEGMDIMGLKLSCYLNVSACQMRHHNFESVVINSSKALNLQANNAKALYRRGAAYLQLQEYEKAKEDLTAAQQLEPKNQAIAKQLQVLKSRVQKLNQYYASAMKKMFS